MSLFEELKRRNVFRVAAAYLALGWIVTQVTATVAPMMHLPEWIAPVVVWIGAIGFPFVLLFAWVYELTPEGLKRESEVDRDASITSRTARKLDTIVIAMLAVAIGLFVFDRFSPRERGVEDENSRAEARPTSSSDVDALVGRPSGRLEPSQNSTNADALVGRPSGRLEPSQNSTNADALVGRPSGRQEPAQPVAPATDNSIAVLPFADMSQNKDQEYFSDGLSEELLNLLAQVPELRVIARTSSFAFKGQNASIATIAQSLNVANVLEGSVRRSGNTVRITAQLVRASDSSHLWSQTFDRELTDIFKVQDEIAGAVVDSLKLKLLPAKEHTGARPPSANTAAYTELLLGRQHMIGENAQSWAAAVAAFDRAIALDPEYAAAWSGLAVAQMFDADSASSVEASLAAKQRALAAAERAVALDPQLGDAYSARAILRSNQEWDWQGAEADFQRALELDPADANTLRRYSGLLNVLGRHDEAMALARRAIELDPLSATAWLRVGISSISTDHAAARAAFERALSINPASDFARAWLALLEIVDGKPEVALTVIDKAGRIWKLLSTALAEHSLGHAEASQKALDALTAEFSSVAPYQIAMVHAWRDETDQAFEWLERARVQRDGGITLIKVDPVSAVKLRADPRYDELLKKIGMSR